MEGPHAPPAADHRLSLDIPRTLLRRLPYWWSQVLFPGRKSKHDRAEPGFRSWLPLALLLLLAALLFLTRLQAPLLEPQEPRYAEIPRQMLAEGRWLVPVLHGQQYLDKPPLLYWATMASYSLFGVNDRAVRVVPGLAGLLTVLLTYLWGRCVAGPRTAFWGSLILCLSARFVYLERMLNFDSLLCLWVTAGLAAAHTALSGTTQLLRWGWWLTAAVCCGLGLLTKGPVALVLVMVPVLAFRALDRRCPRPRLGHAAAFFGVAWLVAGPWYLAVMLREPNYARYFFWQHNVIRFVAPFDHAEPFWFHLPGLLIGMLPWVLLLPGLVLFLSRRTGRAAARRTPALGFFLLAWIWAVFFFSLSGCKRSVYILPALPPLALSLGYYLAQDIPAHPLPGLGGLLPAWHASRLARLATVLVLLSSVGIIALAGVNGLWPPAFAVAAGCLGLGLGAWAWFGKVDSWPVCAATTFAVLFAGLQLLLPAYNRQFALRHELRAHRAALAEGHIPILCYPQRWDSVSFYLPRAEVLVFNRSQRRQLLHELQAHPAALLLVKSGDLLREVLQELPDSLEFVSHQPQGAVTVGLVRTRGVPGAGLYARR